MTIPDDNLNYRPEIKRVLDDILLVIPGVRERRAFGYPSYQVYGKTFTFVGGNGLSIKLGRERVTELLESDSRFALFEPKEGMVWRDWASVEPLSPAECAALTGLLQESIDYVIEHEVNQ